MDTFWISKCVPRTPVPIGMGSVTVECNARLSSWWLDTLSTATPRKQSIGAVELDAWHDQCDRRPVARPCGHLAPCQGMDERVDECEHETIKAFTLNSGQNWCVYIVLNIISSFFVALSVIEIWNLVELARVFRVRAASIQWKSDFMTSIKPSWPRLIYKGCLLRVCYL